VQPAAGAGAAPVTPDAGHGATHPGPGYLLDSAGAEFDVVLRAVRTGCPDRLVPGPVAELLDGRAPDISELHDVAGAALRRFEAIGQYLTADDSPMVVVLDDLHWADLASLQLLTHLADGIAASRLLLVASRRLHESGSLSATLSETLAALARAETLRIELCGLDSEEAQALVAAAAGQHISAQTATRLWARTEGNPFFLREMVELLLSEQRLDEQRLDELEPIPVPGPVREVVLRRVGRLPEAAAALLSVAAAAGRHFDVEVVAEAASVEIEVALEAIDAAVAAGLVVENEHRLGWFRFTHALVAEALYTATGRLRRFAGTGESGRRPPGSGPGTTSEPRRSPGTGCWPPNSTRHRRASLRLRRNRGTRRPPSCWACLAYRRRWWPAPGCCAPTRS